MLRAVAFVAVALLATTVVIPEAGAEVHTFSTAATSGIPFTVFKCTFEVPATPASFTSQSIFPWCGIQQSSGVTPSGDSSFGVLQPVLMFGDDCVSGQPGFGLGPAGDPHYQQDPYWYYSAQYVYPDPVGSTSHTCTTAQGFKAEPGDILVSTMTYDPTSDTMTVAVSQQDGSGLSTDVVAHPWLDPTKSWSPLIGQTVLEVSIEAWNYTGPASWPAAPSSWPVTMTYEGAFPLQFAPKPRQAGLPPVQCTDPSVSESTATVTCTYDLAATQSGGANPTAAVPTPIAITPQFTG